MKFTDAVSVANTRLTDDGYLVAEAFAVRTGVQRYAGHEVGKPDMPFVDVYRPESEVRAADSLKTFSHAPVTLDHPSDPVTSDNWKALAVGEVSTEAGWKDNRISLPLIVKDAGAIQAIKDGKRELSAGYSCKLEFADGVTPEGEPYQATQRDIRANHLAIVAKGRAGSECRIGDNGDNAGNRTTWGVSPLHDHQQKEVPIMDLKTMVLGDKAVQVAATDAALVDAFIASTNKTLSDATSAHDTAIAAKDKEIGTLLAEKKALEDAAVTDADIEAKAVERADVIAKATAFDKAIETKGKSLADIRRSVAAKHMGDAMPADASDDIVAALFAAATKDAKPEDALRTGIINQDRSSSDGDGWSPKVFDAAGVKMKKEAA